MVLYAIPLIKSFFYTVNVQWQAFHRLQWFLSCFLDEPSATKELPLCMLPDYTKVIMCKELAAIKALGGLEGNTHTHGCLPLNNWFGIALAKGHENDNSNNDGHFYLLA